MIGRKAAVVSAGAILVVSILFTSVMTRSGATVVEFEGFTVRTIAIESVNVHLVTAGDNSFMVEAGDRSSFEKIVSEIRAAGVESSSLRAVVVTHGHARYKKKTAYRGKISSQNPGALPELTAGCPRVVPKFALA